MRNPIPLWLATVVAVGCSSSGTNQSSDRRVLPPFSVLLDRANEFDLCNGTFLKIGERFQDHIDASHYTPEERVVVLVWHAGGIIDNGGLEYLFSGRFDGDPEFKLTAEAFKSAGLIRAYEAFQEASKLFPGGAMPNDPTERRRIYEITSEARRDDINSSFWQDFESNERERKLAQYIRSHAEAFRHLQ